MSGVFDTGYVNEVAGFCVNLLKPLGKTPPLAEVRLATVILQMLVVIAQNYTAHASKINDLNIKFVLRVAGFLYSTGDQKYYAAYLLYILLFSNEIKRNNFLRSTDGLILVPSLTRPSGTHIKPISVLANVAEGFLCPFNVHTLEPRYDPNGFVRVWA
jgi:hypothetical protein